MAEQPKGQPSARRRRADGEESRRRILDAAVEVAGERGYDGTSINAVCARSGLPASSIYWHFRDKDDLIAAVIERSFTAWLSAVSLPGSKHGNPTERATTMSTGVAKALLEAPEFLRLGLMLALERRPEEPSARTMFLQVRHTATQRVAAAMLELSPELGPNAVELLTTYAVAGADGLFIAHELGGDSVDLLQLFALHAQVLVDTAARLVSEQTGR